MFDFITNAFYYAYTCSKKVAGCLVNWIYNRTSLKLTGVHQDYVDTSIDIPKYGSVMRSEPTQQKRTVVRGTSRFPYTATEYYTEHRLVTKQERIGNESFSFKNAVFIISGTAQNGESIQITTKNDYFLNDYALLLENIGNNIDIIRVCGIVIGYKINASLKIAPIKAIISMFPLVCIAVVAKLLLLP